MLTFENIDSGLAAPGARKTPDAASDFRRVTVDDKRVINSQAHLYLKGTNWLTSALELMTRLSSTVTRRKLLGVSGVLRGAGAASPLSMFSNVSMGWVVIPCYSAWPAQGAASSGSARRVY